MSETKIQKSISSLDGTIKSLIQSMDHQSGVIKNSMEDLKNTFDRLEKLTDKFMRMIDRCSKTSTRLQWILIFWTAIMAIAIAFQVYFFIF